MQETHIEVGENTDEDIPFALTTFDNDQIEVAFDLTGYSAFEFYIKASPSGADGTPVATLAGGGIVVTSATGGTLTVTVARANHVTPGEKWYLLRGITATAKWKALAFGNYVIKDL